MIREELIRLYQAQKAKQEAAQEKIRQRLLAEEQDRIQQWLKSQKCPWTLQELTQELQQASMEIRWFESERTPSLMLPPCPRCEQFQTVRIYSLADIGGYLIQTDPEPDTEPPVCAKCKASQRQRSLTWQEKLSEVLEEAITALIEREVSP